jgi:hypothetical protein
MHSEFCIVSDFPDVLKVDDDNLPHCSDGPSHHWRDGFAVYFWHGVRVPKQWIMDKTFLTPQIALSEPNMEKRRAACEILGWEKVVSGLDGCIVDHDEDPMIGDLIEVNLPDAPKSKFIKVLCGTGRTFMLPVPQEAKTALEAQAMIYDVDETIIKSMQARS